MLHDYSIGRNSRRCFLTDRPLEPGERFYSVIVPQDGEAVRYEIAESAWQGPPADAVGWWRGTIVQQESRKIVPTPADELLEVLAELCQDTTRQPLANLLGLYLLRRKILQLDASDEAVAQSEQAMTLTHPSTQRTFLIPNIEHDPEVLAELQSSLQSLLYREG